MSLNRISILIILFSLLIFSCKQDEKKQFKFEISGNLTSYESQEILLQSDEINGIKTLFIAEKNEGNFYIKSKKSLPVNQYYLKIGNATQRIPILIDNTNVTVYLDNLDLQESHTIGNSDYQKSYTNYKSTCKTTQDLFSYQKKFIQLNKNTELGAIVLKEILGDSKWRLEQTSSLFSELAPFIQKSDLGKEIDTYITAGLERLKIEKTTSKQVTEEIVVNKPKPQTSEKETPKKENSITNTSENITEYAPFFYADNLSGVEISAKDIFKNNKVTLIDFWASWCAPCRAQNPDFVKLYNQYHHKGFEILSVSEDKDLNNWQVAVSLDKMKWKHVIDDYKRIANMYHVKAIPYALLVDQNGGIIAKKITPNQLESILQSRLK